MGFPGHRCSASAVGLLSQKTFVPGFLGTSAVVLPKLNLRRGLEAVPAEATGGLLA